MRAEAVTAVAGGGGRSPRGAFGIRVSARARRAGAAAAIGAAALLGGAGSASAQWIVHDPTNFLALQLLSGQRSLEHNAAQRAAANREDIRDAREVTRRVEDERLRAVNASRGAAASCNMLTGLMGGTSLILNTRANGTATQNAALDFLTGLSPNTGSHQGEAQGREQRMSAICARFATQDMVSQGICPPGTPVTVPTGGGAAPPRISPALDASTLMANGVLSGEAGDAARLFIATAVAPTPMGALPNNTGSTEAGREMISQRQGAIARISAASRVIADYDARRRPMNDPNSTVRNFMEGTARRMVGYNPNGGNFPDGVSLHEWNRLRATSFYLDTGFQTAIGVQSVEQNSKDLAAMMSVQNYMLWKLYEQLEQGNLLHAMSLRIMEDMNQRQIEGQR